MLHECDAQLSFAGFCEKVAELQLPVYMLVQVTVTEERWPILAANQLGTGCQMWRQIDGRAAATEAWAWSVARHDGTSCICIHTALAEHAGCDDGCDDDCDDDCNGGCHDGCHDGCDWCHGYSSRAAPGTDMADVLWLGAGSDCGSDDWSSTDH